MCPKFHFFLPNPKPNPIRSPIYPFTQKPYNQVDGKEFHYFLSHKKEHTKHGSVPRGMLTGLGLGLSH